MKGIFAKDMSNKKLVSGLSREFLHLKLKKKNYLV